MTSPTPAMADDRPPFEWKGAIAIAVVVFVAHIVVNATTPYGMDFPPAIAIMAVLERFIGGDSLVSLRMLPAIAGAAITLLAMGIARELGGGRFAQLFTAAACAMHPLFLRPGNLFQPVVFDQLWWTAALFALARFERDARRTGSASPRPPHWAPVRRGATSPVCCRRSM